MKELSLLGAATAMLAAEVAINRNARKALERVATKVEKTAKSEFGAYQPATGSFAAWEELAESTQEERARLGYTPDDPLLREGDLRDSISHEVADLVAVIGSTSEIAEHHEFGTSKMPPRPFLGPAVERNKKAIIKELGGAVVDGLIGDDRIHFSLGYDSVVE
ncbi:MAG TPA: HK97-gp10 family putative phage morphogenesis protein [Sphingobium sp.]|uniref:HK97-gp10 family putative phage morphogenesis protein n=1 Tax=Sphingobium sp. TaxID=1912891 RepID=UPI002ED354B2